MPVKSGELRRVMASGLIATANSIGDKGHPWRHPRDNWKNPDRVELVVTQAAGAVYNN